MKKSRLNLFKTTSMTISVLGLIMIIATIAIAAYIGISAISDGVSSGVSSGEQYDKLAVLKSDYSSIDGEYNATRSKIYASASPDLKKKYVDAELELIKAKTAVDNVESALKANKPSEEVGSRITEAENQIKVAKDALTSVK
ncbi:MAG: hypothetical protein ACRC1M_07260 [Methanobacteriaceae archaeon]